MASKELNSTSWINNANLKAYYRFSAGALTTDSSGEGHTLTAISDPVEQSLGVFGYCVTLGGNDAYSATNHADFRPTGSFTVGMWVNPQQANVYQNIICSFNQTASAYSGFILGVTSANKARLFISNNTGLTDATDFAQIVGGTTITDGVWKFVVGTWDGSNLKLYVNGVSDAVAVGWASAPAYDANNYVRFGCDYTTASGANGNFLLGYLDDVFLINGTALTAAQVLGIWSLNTRYTLIT